MAQKRVAQKGIAQSKVAQNKLTKPDAEKRRMVEILRILKLEYPGAECSLTFHTPYQLLVAVMLSAQCTDERVNQVTPALFEAFPDAHAMAEAKLSEIETLIRSVNFYKNKSKAIKETSQILVEKYQGEVPRKMEELIELRGVGRKTANVVLGVAFRVPGLVVDTHVGRISRRLGFTRSTDPHDVEHELMKWVPEEDWIEYAHLLILHGRKICTARKAYCEQCVVAHLCPKIGVGR